MPYAQLEKLWKYSLQKKNAQENDTTTWNDSMEALYELGIGMEETMQYLYSTRPSLEQFLHWLRSNENRLPEKGLEETENVLTENDLSFWEANGYVVLRNAVPKEDAIAAGNAIWEFLGADPLNSATWYRGHDALKGLMLLFTYHPALDKNRLSPRIKRAYEQLYKGRPIYRRIDKVSFNPPESPHYRFAGDGLHWDVSLKQPIPFGLQGLLYLTDCEAGDGAFHCVPGFHKNIGGWLNQLPADVNPRGAVKNLKPVAVTGKAGDFVIWHQALPHCATPNHGRFPRMVQYLTYLPAGYKEEKEWL